ncbi:MAG: hypothetical protein WDN46_15865 [Methylocella sp.]
MRGQKFQLSRNAGNVIDVAKRPYQRHLMVDVIHPLENAIEQVIDTIDAVPING